MKRTLCFILLLSVLSVITAYAHPGSLDEYGGHVDYDSDEYHYHHGWPAHEHNGDYCEYNWIDKTDKGYIGYITQAEYDRQHQYDYSERDKYVPEDAHHLNEYESLQQQQNERNKENSSNSVKIRLLFIALIVFLIKPKKKNKYNTENSNDPIITTTSFVAEQQKVPMNSVSSTTNSGDIPVFVPKTKQPQAEPLTTDKWAVESIVYTTPPPEKDYTLQPTLPAYPKKEETAKKSSSEYWEKVPTNTVPVDPYCVYWTPNGKSFHSTDKCFALRKAKVITSGPMAYAFSEGHRSPCSKCVGENYTIK
ncbi:MAG: hypothetical protein IKY90_00235 [Oscillospiraceae bacterium]|nr:hypothetical protein [Oscillospiraceae bacterium]